MRTALHQPPEDLAVSAVKMAAVSQAEAARVVSPELDNKALIVGMSA